MASISSSTSFRSNLRTPTQLLALDTGALVAISSASVYADEQGRTLDEAQGVADFPDFPVPIPETQPTVEPGDETYSTKKAKIERILLENGRVPAAIVRPCAIYGKGDRMGREWFFVKRALDRRPHVVLTNRGAGRFHTTASENIGELVRLLADRAAHGRLQLRRSRSAERARDRASIGAAAGHRFAEVLLDEPGGRGDVGQTPWSAPKPLLIDMAKAEQELGYRPATTWGDGAAAPGALADRRDARSRLARGPHPWSRLPEIRVRGRRRARRKSREGVGSSCERRRQGRMRAGRAGRIRPHGHDRQARRACGRGCRRRRAARALPGDVHPRLSVEPLGSVSRRLGRSRSRGRARSLRAADAAVGDGSRARLGSPGRDRARERSLARGRRQRARRRDDLQLAARSTHRQESWRFTTAS